MRRRDGILDIRMTGVTVVDVLDLISRGHTYARILNRYSALSLDDICYAARVARDIVTQYNQQTTPQSAPLRSLSDFYLSRARCGTGPTEERTWPSDMEEELVRLYRSGAPITEIAKILNLTPECVFAKLEEIGGIDK